MTWFEAEQIEMYLDRLERLLDEWRLEPFQMRIESAELSRAIRKVEAVSNDDTQNPLMRRYMSDLHHRIFNCKNQIQERLKR
jgi:hypothetical protein